MHPLDFSVPLFRLSDSGSIVPFIVVDDAVMGRGVFESREPCRRRIGVRRPAVSGEQRRLAARFRGRPVDAPPLHLGQAAMPGVLISERQSGPFRLEIREVWAE